MKVQYYLKRIIILLVGSGWTFVGLYSAEQAPDRVVNIHYVPGLLILLLALIAWKWERFGGILMLVLGIFILLAYTWIAYGFFPLSHLIIVLTTMALPLIGIGYWFIKGSNQGNELR